MLAIRILLEYFSFAGLKTATIYYVSIYPRAHGYQLKKHLKI